MMQNISVINVVEFSTYCRVRISNIWLKGSVSSSIPCTCRLLVGLCLSPCSWAMKWRQQRQTKTRNVQGMLDETDPLREVTEYIDYSES